MDPSGCPVSEAIGRYGLDVKTVLRIVRMNWRISVLSVVCASGDKGLHYSEISNLCELNPRTLSIILKELIGQGLILKKESFPRGGVIYCPTKAGLSIARSGCPLVDMAVKARGKTRG